MPVVVVVGHRDARAVGAGQGQGHAAMPGARRRPARRCRCVVPHEVADRHRLVEAEVDRQVAAAEASAPGVVPLGLRLLSVAVVPLPVTVGV